MAGTPGGIPGSPIPRPGGAPAGGSPAGAGMPAVPIINKALEAVAQVIMAKVGPALAGFGSVITSAGATIASALTTTLNAALDAPSKSIAAALAPLKAVGDAAWKITAPFQQLAGSINPFVEALNPALAKELSYSMRELFASVGILVQPIAQELAPLLREVAASLQPAFRALAPVVATLAQSLGRVVAVVAQAMSGALQALAPTLVALADLFGQVVRTLAPLMAVQYAIIEAIAPAFKSIVEAIAPIFSSLAKAMVYLTAAILKTAGQVGILDKMIEATKRTGERGQQSSGQQSIQGQQYSSYAELGRSLALASTLAGQSGPAKQDDVPSMTAEILENLKVIRDGDTWGPLLKELQTMLDAVGRAIVSGMKSGVYENTLGHIAPTNIGTYASKKRNWVDQAADWWYGNK